MFCKIGPATTCMADYPEHIAPKSPKKHRLGNEWKLQVAYNAIFTRKARSQVFPSVKTGSSTLRQSWSYLPWRVLRGVIRIRAHEDGRRQPFKLRNLQPQQIFCTNRQSRRPDCFEGGSSKIPRLTRGSPTAGALRRRKTNQYIDYQTDNRDFNHNRDFARTMKSVAGLL